MKRVVRNASSSVANELHFDRDVYNRKHVTASETDSEEESERPIRERERSAITSRIGGAEQPSQKTDAIRFGQPGHWHQLHGHIFGGRSADERSDLPPADGGFFRATALGRPGTFRHSCD